MPQLVRPESESASSNWRWRVTNKQRESRLENIKQIINQEN